MPESERLLAASGQDEDQRLLSQVSELAATHPRDAIGLLVPRLQGRDAPTALHDAYRDLLRRENLRDGLLVHGQIRIAMFVANEEPRKALGMLQECLAIDATFLPDDPDTVDALATAAVRMGMRRMALKLCLGRLASWPRDARTPATALLAATLMAQADENAAAASMLGNVAASWPDHPQHGELVAHMRRLQRDPGA